MYEGLAVKGNTMKEFYKDSGDSGGDFDTFVSKGPGKNDLCRRTLSE